MVDHVEVGPGLVRAQPAGRHQFRLEGMHPGLPEESAVDRLEGIALNDLAGGGG
ncbi:MAG: hypothetical protein Q9O62_00470 [Ardenticatenia bacterium]|nr:hypothetical protein [Ardenticatenia bacterium]